MFLSSLWDTCREVSKVVVTYGRHVLGPGSAASPAYDARYKGIWICLLILSRAMSGSYVNFGVFELYKDPALKVGTAHVTCVVRCS